MAYEESLISITIEAGQDLSASQYRFCTTGASGVSPTSAGGRIDGVIQNDPSSAGQPTTVGTYGATKIEASGVIARGALVASAAGGKAVAQSTETEIAGVALEASTADGDIISILLKPYATA